MPGSHPGCDSLSKNTSGSRTRTLDIPYAFDGGCCCREQVPGGFLYYPSIREETVVDPRSSHRRPNQTRSRHVRLSGTDGDRYPTYIALPGLLFRRVQPRTREAERFGKRGARNVSPGLAPSAGCYPAAVLLGTAFLFVLRYSSPFRAGCLLTDPLPSPES